LLVGKGRLEEAIRHLQQALSVKPDYAEARNNLGTAFYQQGRTSEAIRQF
jgi:Flp pilus assembly protein TadD